MKLKREDRIKPAFKKLQAVLARDPEHRTGHQAMVELALGLSGEKNVDAALKRSAEWLVSRSFLENEQRKVINLFNRLERNRRAGLLGDRALMQVVSAARQLDDAGAVAAATVVLVREHPHSDLAPRALWTTAEVQERAGRDDLAYRTLEGLIESYPTHPFAEHARNRLETEYDAEETSISLPPPEADDDEFL